ncbi:hypothetical protein BX265_6932 [Streptomyces sp. TLI_235]|nr:hypothetical protein BX265_6932 [Streptomyces sp. TLI_235]
MTDHTLIDPDRIENLAEEFRAAGRNLSACIDRYSQGCPDPENSYGSLPAGEEAAAEHGASTQDLLAMLQGVRARYDEYADSLAASAALYRAAEARDRAAVARLRREVQDQP